MPLWLHMFRLYMYAVILLLQLYNQLSDAHMQEFSLEFFNSGTPCCFCPSSDRGMPWRDLRPTADWVSNCYSHTTFMESHPLTHAIFTLEHITIASFIPDYMHCKHLGTDMNVAGAVLWLLVYEVLSGRTSSLMEAPHTTNSIPSLASGPSG